MGRYDLADFEWSVIQPLLPNKPRCIPRVDDRRMLNGSLGEFCSGGLRWQHPDDRQFQRPCPPARCGIKKGPRSLHGSFTRRISVHASVATPHGRAGITFSALGKPCSSKTGGFSGLGLIGGRSPANQVGPVQRGGFTALEIFWPCKKRLDISAQGIPLFNMRIAASLSRADQETKIRNLRSLN